MIEFLGYITGDCKKFLMKKQIEIQTKASIIVTAIFLIPIILASVLWKHIALIVFIPPLAMVVFSLLPPDKSAQKIFIPKRVYLDLEEETIVHECDKMERFHMLHSVKRVVDYGEWYYIIFNYENRDPYFVCQKNLLTKGTLEEFEALFEGKIERRTK